jgi:hypothetical protein
MRNACKICLFGNSLDELDHVCAPNDTARSSERGAGSTTLFRSSSDSGILHPKLQSYHCPRTNAPESRHLPTNSMCSPVRVPFAVDGGAAARGGRVRRADVGSV